MKTSAPTTTNAKPAPAARSLTTSASSPPSASKSPSPASPNRTPPDQTARQPDPHHPFTRLRCAPPGAAARPAGLSFSGQCARSSASDRPHEVDSPDSGSVAEARVQALDRCVPLLVAGVEFGITVGERPVDFCRLQGTRNAAPAPGSLYGGHSVACGRRRGQRQLRKADDFLTVERDKRRLRRVGGPLHIVRDPVLERFECDVLKTWDV